MKRILATLTIALSMVLATVGFVTAPAEAGLKVNCIQRPVQRGQVDFHKEVGGVLIYWRYCWPTNDGNPNHGWVRLTKAKFVTVRDNDSIPACGWADLYQGMRFRLYVWNPLTGANENTRWVTVQCEPGFHSASETVRLDTFPRFHYTAGTLPKWKVNITEMWDAGVPDRHGSRFGKFPHP